MNISKTIIDNKKKTRYRYIKSFFFILYYACVFFVSKLQISLVVNIRRTRKKIATSTPEREARKYKVKGYLHIIAKKARMDSW